MKTLQQHFDDWAKSAHGSDYRTKLSQLQLQETERAFMSGFASYYFFSLELTKLSDSKAERALAALHQEIQDYFKSLKSMPRSLEKN